VIGPLDRPWSGGPNPLWLTELDVATGMVLGSVAPEPWPESGDDPLAALEREARELLGGGGRCVLAFSGGRDSSALLAVFLRVARREGFDEPAAVTARWPEDPDSDEREWQEHVARRLGLRDWEIVNPGADVDLLGERSTRLLTELGLLWPAPFAALWTMVEAARDGVLVTGEGGDEVFAHWSFSRVWSQLKRGRALRHVARALGYAALPSPLRRRRALGRAQPYQSWLTDEARHAQRLALAEEEAIGERPWWPGHLRETASGRSLWLSRRSMASLCARRGARFATPLVAPSFLAALARRGGRTGWGDRTEAMTAVFGPVLDREILGRSTKATFGTVFWGPASRAFAEEWDGVGLDPRWVDPDALRAAWKEPTPTYGTALPLQAAWLAARRRREPGIAQGHPPGEPTP